MDNPFTKTNRARVIIEHLKLAPAMTVLDAGCGPGRLTLPLAETVGPQGQVLAVDIQAEMLARVRAKVEAAGLGNVEYLQAGLGDGKLPKSHFDRAVLVTVLGEIPDQDFSHAGDLRSAQTRRDSLRDRSYLRPTLPVAAVGAAGGRRVGFHKTDFFGKRLAYTLHLEKPA